MGSVKNADCEGVIQALQALSKMEVSIQTAVKVTKLMRLVMQQFQDFGTVRQQSIEKYCERDEEGNLAVDKLTNQYKIADLGSFEKEMVELYDIVEEYTLELELDELPDRIKPEIIIRLSGLVNLEENNV